MNKLVLTTAIIGAASLATACTSLGTVSATWELQDWSDANKAAVPAACPAGGDTAVVYALPVGDTNMADADEDLFNCTDGGGITAGHISGSYNVWVAITSNDKATLFAQSDVKQLDVVDGKTSPVDFQFQVNRGDITAAWTLVGAASKMPLTCADAGASGVEFDETGTGAALVPDMFDCAPMMGTTFPLPIDNYTLSAVALGGTPEGAIGPEATVPGLKVQWGNHHVNAGSVVLQIDGK